MFMMLRMAEKVVERMNARENGRGCVMSDEAIPCGKVCDCCGRICGMDAGHVCEHASVVVRSGIGDIHIFQDRNPFGGINKLYFLEPVSHGE